MSREGTRASKLTQQRQELFAIFEVVLAGDSLQKAREKLENLGCKRDYKSVALAYRVAKEISQRNVEQLSEDQADDIVANAGYGATVNYVRTMIWQWQVWQREKKGKGGTIDGGSDYRQQAKAAAYEQHLKEVCELADRLRSRLIIPHPIDLYTDFMQRVPAEGWYWHQGKGEIAFPEEDNPVFASFRQHTEKISFWQGYVRLKADWAELGTQCQQLLTVLKVEAQLLTGCNWTKAWGQVGITEGFAVSAYYDAVYSVQGGAGLTQLYAQEGETGLRFAGWIIAWAPPDQHPVLQQAHQELRNTFARHQLTKDVVTTYEKLTQEANHLRVELLPAKMRKVVLEETSRCNCCP